MVGTNYTYIYEGDRSYYKQYFNTWELNEKIEYQLSDSHRLKGGIGLVFNDADIDPILCRSKGRRNSNAEYKEEVILNEDFSLFYPSMFIHG